VMRVSKRTQNKEYYEYLVKWRNMGFKDASWVSEKELTCLRESSSSVESLVISTCAGAHVFLTKDV
jgi:hypothetical protein